MENQKNSAVDNNMQAVATYDLSNVEGGLMSIDMSGMPSRDVMCGTMWVLDKLMKPFTRKVM